MPTNNTHDGNTYDTLDSEPFRTVTNPHNHCTICLLKIEKLRLREVKDITGTMQQPGTPPGTPFTELGLPSAAQGSLGHSPSSLCSSEVFGFSAT